MSRSSKSARAIRICSVGKWKSRKHMGVSKSQGTPKSSIINHPFWGTVPLYLETPIYGLFEELGFFPSDNLEIWHCLAVGALCAPQKLGEGLL